MIEVFKVDADGYIVESELIDDAAETELIREQLPGGIHTPKWDDEGKQWAEGADPETIAEALELEQLELEYKRERQARVAAIERFVVYEIDNLITSDQLTEEQKKAFLEVFDPWHVNREYSIGDKVRYKGVVYEVIQSHRSQSDWRPASVPALYMVYLQRETEEDGEPVEVINEWQQPQGSHDAYNIDDKVMYGGKVYVSLIHNNVWGPTDYPQGWELVEEATTGGGSDPEIQTSTARKGGRENG